ncbi:MAG: hypothetical protein FD123_1694 [Bacteroidetes bacterium]|nr:MAG: hypothetical protein FD123_1694 [Bacteroidota bacterium]
MEELEALFPAEALDYAVQISAENQWQFMLDLGYLAKENFSREEDRVKALHDFRKEYHEAGFKLHHIGLPFGLNHQLSEGEAHFLRKLAGIEGQFNFEKLPETGRTSLFSRIAKMRLDLLGFGSGANDLPFSFADIKALDDAGNWFSKKKFSTRIEVLNAMGDTGDFVQRAWEELYRQDIVYFKLIPTVQPIDELEQGKHFSRALWKSIGEDSKTWKAYKKAVLDRNDGDPDTKFLQSQIARPDNSRMIRFIQLMLQSCGAYTEEIDEDLGPVTYDALIDAVYLLDKADDDDDDPDLREYIAYLGQGYWAFNQAFFFEAAARLNKPETDADLFKLKAGVVSSEPEDEEMSFYKRFSEEFGKLQQKDKEKADKVQAGILNVAKKLAGKEEVHFMGFADSFRSSRFFKGLKRFFRLVGRFFKRIFNKLAEFIGEMKDRNVLNFVQLIFRKAGDALRVLGEGLRFLFSDRKIYTKDSETKAPLVITDFTMTFDAVTTVQAGLSPEVLSEHMKHCLRSSRSLETVLVFIGKVIHFLLLLAGPAGWFKLALEIIRIFRDIKKGVDPVRTVK